jgi:thiol reductant ABC exporter CydC subunit
VVAEGLLASALRQERRAVAGALGAGLLVGVASIGLAGTSAWLIVRAWQRPAVLSLSVAMGLVQLFALARAAGRYLERTQTHRAALAAMGSVRAGVARTLEPLVPAGLGPRPGEAVDLVLADVDRVQDLLTAVAGPLITGWAAGLVAVAVVTSVVPVAGLSLLGGLVVVGGAMAPLAARLGARVESKRDEVEGVVVALASEVASAGPEIALNGGAPGLLARLDQLEDRLDRVRRAGAARAGLMNGLAVAVTGTASLAALAAASVALREGRIAPAMVAVPALVTLAALELVAGVAPSIVALRGDLAARDRLEALAGRRAPVTDPSAPGDLGAGRRVALEEVSVAFDGAPVLSGVGATWSRGDLVVLEGPSGGGKTTLAHLVARFLDPAAGRLSLDGVDYRDLLAHQVRARVGFVDDAPYVFAASLGANLRVAAPEASDDELLEVLVEVGLDHVSERAGGLDTPLGGCEVGLSGGERRRLGVARELLARRPLAIFDEPTEGLDEGAARLVARALAARSREGAVLVISHHDAPRLPGAQRWRLADAHLDADAREVG